MRAEIARPYPATFLTRDCALSQLRESGLLGKFYLALFALILALVPVTITTANEAIHTFSAHLTDRIFPMAHDQEPEFGDIAEGAVDAVDAVRQARKVTGSWGGAVRLVGVLFLVYAFLALVVMPIQERIYHPEWFSEQPPTDMQAPSSQRQRDAQLPAQSGSSAAVCRPSFNCAENTRPADILVCREPELCFLDRELSDLYSQLRARRRGIDWIRLRDSQRDWWAYRRNRCGDSSCLLKAYGDRIEVLRNEILAQ